eukprot:12230322-Prorocentrum_lima.AAC.1
MVKSGPHAGFRTRLIYMRARFVHGLANVRLLHAEYAPSAENPANALTKGLTAQLTGMQETCSSSWSMTTEK